MQWLIDEDDGVLNLKQSHDNYMSYARDLLDDTKGRLFRMTALSNEIHYLAQQIKPSVVKKIAPKNLEDSPARTEACEPNNGAGEKGNNGTFRRTDNRDMLDIPSVTNGCIKQKKTPPISYPETGPVKKSFQRNSKRGQSEEWEIRDGRVWRKRIPYERISYCSTIQSPSWQTGSRTWESTGDTMEATGNCESSNSLTRVGKPRKHERPRQLKSLDLHIVISKEGCKGEIRESEGTMRRHLEHNAEGTHGVNGHRSESKRSIATRKTLDIPRVIIQSFAKEEILCEVPKVPKIMETFPRPLQLTARSFRLPVFRQQSSS